MKIDEENGGFGRERGGKDKVCARDARENCLRFNPICAKHMIFVTQLTREQVAKTSCQNPLNKILKILSKSFLQVGDPPVSESQNLLCKLATGASTRDQVMKINCKNVQNPKILKNFPSAFRNWGTHSPRSHESKSQVSNLISTTFSLVDDLFVLPRHCMLN